MGLTDRSHEISYRSDGAGPFAINDASVMLPQDRSWSGMVAMMKADVAGVRQLGDSIVTRAYPGIFIAWTHRLAHTLHVRGRRLPALLVCWFCHLLTGAEIKPAAVLGPGLLVVHPSGVIINGGTVAGARLRLYGSNTLGANFSQGIHGSPQLGDDVIVGTHGIILGPCVVGDRVAIGAASLLLSDAADDAKVKGIPAR